MTQTEPLYSASTEISGLLREAAIEPSPQKSKTLLQQAVRVARDGYAKSASVSMLALGIEGYKELALLETKPADRCRQWESGLRFIVGDKQPANAIACAGLYATFAGDFFEDPFSGLTSGDRRDILARAKTRVEAVMDQSLPVADFGMLLTRKAVLLRKLATFAFNQSSEHKRTLQEAHRCAELSVKKEASGFALLELGHCEWALASIEPTDERYVSRLAEAERLIKHAIALNCASARFTLCQFYRRTYRTYDACMAFQELLGAEENRRSVLRIAYIYGESAVQLSYSGAPEETVQYHLTRAHVVVEASLAEGYDSARPIVTLAFLNAILSNDASSTTALTELHRDRPELSWKEVMQLIMNATDTDLAAMGFAIGITESGVLSQLGTFAARYGKDPVLGEALYRAAIKTHPRNAVALTNLARLLIRRGTDAAYAEARTLLRKAQSFSDRRFNWWRQVLAELNQRDVISSEAKADSSPARVDLDVVHVAALRDLPDRFAAVRSMTDPQKRGFALESVFFNLVSLTPGVSAPSYRMSRPLVEKTHQIDGHFEHRHHTYRVECKWTSEPIGYDAMLAFADKIDAVGVSGLFLSMSGFDDRTIAKASEIRKEKAVLLMDGKEFEQIIDGIHSFHDVMTLKRLHFDQRSEVYYQVLRPSGDGSCCECL